MQETEGNDRGVEISAGVMSLRRVIGWMETISQGEKLPFFRSKNTYSILQEGIQRR